MKKMTRIAFLLTALTLTGAASAQATYYGYCYNLCGYWVLTALGECCNRHFPCADGTSGSSYYWESWEYAGVGEACIIT